MRNGRSSLHSIEAIRSPMHPCPIANIKTLLSQVQQHWQHTSDYIQELESIQTV